jgi:DNA (cytosine-5)-methyltransferase 1
MRYLSLFSGIEAATVAWEQLGWEPVAFAEFEDFPKAVLAHHYPNVPDLGDVTKITKEQIIALGHIDIVVGGSPCQDLSIAGKRAGLRNDDGSTTRSGLFDEQIRIFEIAREYCGARYLLWENVPGAFSSNNGLDFAYVLGSMVGGSIPVPFDGWKNSGVAVSGNGRRLVEWRVLDAQYFGAPQRRRRIFALLDTGAWWSRSPILFEQEGLRGHIAQGRVEREGAAEGAGNCFTPSSFGGYQAGVGTLRSNGGDLGCGSETIIYENHAQDSRVTESIGVCPTLHSQMGTGGGNVPFVMATGQINAEILKDKCPTLNCAHEQPIYCGADL